MAGWASGARGRRGRAARGERGGERSAGGSGEEREEGGVRKIEEVRFWLDLRAIIICTNLKHWKVSWKKISWKMDRFSAWRSTRPSDLLEAGTHVPKLIMARARALMG